MSTSIVQNRDCLEAMKEFPDKFFDLAIVDPPYGISIHKMSYCKSGAIMVGGAKRRDYSHTTDWDSSIPNEKYFEELFRVSKAQIVWGGNYFTKHLPPSKSFICWDKRTAEKYSNDFADCEMAWCSENLGVARVFRFLYSGMLQEDMKNKEDRFHPTQKPVALYQWILSKYAKQGDKILDTHLGSGSSRIACYNGGYDFWGYEIDKEYFEKQEERFEHHTSQLRMEF